MANQPPHPERPAEPQPAPAAEPSDAQIIRGILALTDESHPAGTRLRAWELLGRRRGLFREQPNSQTAPVVRRTPPLRAAPDAETDDEHPS